MSDYEEEEEMYLYLDFDGRLSQDFFTEEDIFFKAVGLDQKHPVIQIGQCVFTGTYQDAIGTNVFFEEDPNSEPSTNIFEKTPEFRLRYLTKQFKTLNLRWAKIPEEAELPIDPKELRDLKFKEDYETLLQKLEKRTLNIETVPDRDDVDDKMETQESSQITPIEVLPTALVEEFTKASTSTQKLEEKDQQNNEISQKFSEFLKITPSERRPIETCEKILSKLDILEMMSRENLKRVVTKEDVEIPSSLKLNYYYHYLRNKLLCGTQLFPVIVLDYDKDTLEGAADVNRCVRQGIIEPSDENPRILSREEKDKILTLENSENLSIPMRYCVIRKLMKQKKRFIKQAEEEELQHMCEFGLTVIELYKLLKVLAKDLRKYIYLNLQEPSNTS